MTSQPSHSSWEKQEVSRELWVSRGAAFFQSYVDNGEFCLGSWAQKGTLHLLSSPAL